MMDWLSLVETDKVIHTVETNIVKLVVKIESFGMSFDDFDKKTVSFDELQLKQADLRCVHALIELHLHEIYVVPKGCAMFCVVKWLKGLKSPFRKLLHNHGNLHKRVNKIRIELDEAQKAIDRDPSSSILREEHAHYLLAFKEAQLDEERFLKQKAKIECLKAGDSNTAYFNKIVKSKCTRNRNKMVCNASNNLYDGN
nr:RNA-directed DNA polymerase, eukaryota, reverse transcriptase zinc-binding domain protein [Tanacetum cinerariifolium]